MTNGMDSSKILTSSKRCRSPRSRQTYKTAKNWPYKKKFNDRDVYGDIESCLNGDYFVSYTDNELNFN